MIMILDIPNEKSGLPIPITHIIFKKSRVIE